MLTEDEYLQLVVSKVILGAAIQPVNRDER
jgi:hypothetical protein